MKRRYPDVFVGRSSVLFHGPATSTTPSQRVMKQEESSQKMGLQARARARASHSRARRPSPRNARLTLPLHALTREHPTKSFRIT
jgi:hypothetical protein